jgi:hypothetical protein
MAKANSPKVFKMSIFNSKEDYISMVEQLLDRDLEDWEPDFIELHCAEVSPMQMAEGLEQARIARANGATGPLN